MRVKRSLTSLTPAGEKQWKSVTRIQVGADYKADTCRRWTDTMRHSRQPLPMSHLLYTQTHTQKSDNYQPMRIHVSTRTSRGRYSVHVLHVTQTAALATTEHHVLTIQETTPSSLLIERFMLTMGWTWHSSHLTQREYCQCWKTNTVRSPLLSTKKIHETTESSWWYN